MVYILDEGSEFDAPLDRIWTYVRSQDEHQHRAIKAISREMVADNAVMITNEVTMPNMPTVRNKLKITMYPPFGTVQEYLEGPMTGTKAFLYYTPKGNKTGVTVVGNFLVAGMDDDMTKRIAMGVLETAFNEDNENLKRLTVAQ
jgi:hypothetical protein